MAKQSSRNAYSSDNDYAYTANWMQANISNIVSTNTKTS